MSRPDAVTLTTYFGERQRSGGRFAADALLDLYGRHELAASVLLRGAEGFGSRGGLRTDRSLTLSEDLPLTAVAVDRAERIKPLAAQAAALAGPGLMTMEPAWLAGGPDPAPAGAGGEARLTVFLGRQQRAGRVPAFVALCELLRRRGLAGATALLGVDGTAHGHRERAAFFGRNAATPVMVIAVGAGERIAAVLPELAGLLPRPLLAIEESVQVCKRDGQLLSAPAALAGAPDGAGGPDGSADAGGTGRPGGAGGERALWGKLTVYTSESALHEGQPVHRAIMRRLRAAGISGATSQRGVWGFHGAGPPHGDRLLQLGRRVPVVTTVIDAPERITAAFAVIDELTAESGLVTSETVQVLRPAA